MACTHDCHEGARCTCGADEPARWCERIAFWICTVAIFGAAIAIACICGASMDWPFA